ncbi:hypothetical protein AB0K14_12715 [Actinosynnema sp. NPDC050801]|uniref:hypothetical protein n=1 Tax=unclassified Actinosynnema TaxID=2637065 RepID=UPI003400191F
MEQQQASYPQPYPHQVVAKPTKFGALAWTALILGVVGIVGSPIIIFNNLTAVVAGVGFVLGFIALFGTKKIIAVIGVVLCVLGIVFTVMAQKAAVEEFDEIINGSTNQGQVSDGTDSAAPAEQKPETAQAPPTWGQRYTWANGLAVEVSTPAPCTPSRYAAPSNIVRAAKVTVTVTNGTDKPFDAGLLSFGGDAQFDGRKAETVFDSSGECGGGGAENATVLPGKAFTYETAFAVGAQPGELQITLRPDFGSDKAVFVGQV